MPYSPEKYHLHFSVTDDTPVKPVRPIREKYKNHKSYGEALDNYELNMERYKDLYRAYNAKITILRESKLELFKDDLKKEYGIEWMTHEQFEAFYNFMSQRYDTLEQIWNCSNDLIDLLEKFKPKKSSKNPLDQLTNGNRF